MTDGDRRKVVETALQMFCKGGVRSVTMDNIAQQLHISKRTLYETFENKEALLAECLEKVYIAVGKVHHRLFQQASNPLLLALYMVKASAVHNHAYRLLLEDTERYYPEVHERYCKLHSSEFREVVAKALHYAEQNNYLRPGADVETAVGFICDTVQRRPAGEEGDAERYKKRIGEVCFTYIRGLLSVDTLLDYERGESRYRDLVETVMQTDVADVVTGNGNENK